MLSARQLLCCLLPALLSNAVCKIWTQTHNLVSGRSWPMSVPMDSMLLIDNMELLSHHRYCHDHHDISIYTWQQWHMRRFACDGLIDHWHCQSTRMLVWRRVCIQVWTKSVGQARAGPSVPRSAILTVTDDTWLPNSTCLLNQHFAQRKIAKW